MAELCILGAPGEEAFLPGLVGASEPNARTASPFNSSSATPVIDPKLLEILACPVTHQSLTEASAEMLETINAKIRAGGFKNVGGVLVEKELTAALMRECKTLAYPITEGIPVLLENEGMSLE